MRNELADQLCSILSDGNFNSTVKNNLLIKEKNINTAVVIQHDEVDSTLALKHIQDFIEDDILENESAWLTEYDLDHVSKLNIITEENQTTLY